MAYTLLWPTTLVFIIAECQKCYDQDLGGSRAFVHLNSNISTTTIAVSMVDPGFSMAMVYTSFYGQK